MLYRGQNSRLLRTCISDAIKGGGGGGGVRGLGGGVGDEYQEKITKREPDGSR